MKTKLKPGDTVRVVGERGTAKVRSTSVRTRLISLFLWRKPRSRCFPLCRSTLSYLEERRSSYFTTVRGFRKTWTCWRALRRYPQRRNSKRHCGRDSMKWRGFSTSVWCVSNQNEPAKISFGYGLSDLRGK